MTILLQEDSLHKYLFISYKLQFIEKWEILKGIMK